MITNEERQKLHTLLDVMIDEKESRAVLSSAIWIDDKIKIRKYNLLLEKTEYDQ